MAKKILYCESNLDGTVGGSYYSQFFLVRGIDKQRYEPIVVFYTDNPLIPRYREIGVETHVFRLPQPFKLSRQRSAKWLGRGILPIQKLVNFFRLLIVQGIKLAWYIKKNRIDLVHLNNSIIRSHTWMLASMIVRVKCITHERGINEIFPRLAIFFAKRLDAIVCISKAVRDNLVAKGVRNSNIHIIYNGLDPNIMKLKTSAVELRSEYGIPTRAPVIGIVGNIKEWKGQDVVVRATAKLKEAFPDVVCLLVGDTAPSDRYFLKKLEDIVINEGLRENVVFTGYQAHVADFLNLMDIAVHASVRPEPFGRVLIESMALKKPLIGANGGAVPEIILNGETGLLFSPGDHNDLARAITTLLNDRQLALSMGERGSQRLISEFTIRENIRRTEALYASLFENQPTS